MHRHKENFTEDWPLVLHILPTTTLSLLSLFTAVPEVASLSTWQNQIPKLSGMVLCKEFLPEE